jgi:hypothetical protein
MQLPFAGFGVIPGGQHWPHAATMLGSQHLPSGVITSLELAQGATHLLPTRTCPLGQGIPVNGVGQYECVGLRLLSPGNLGWPQSGGTAGWWVSLQIHTSASGPDGAKGFVSAGHWHVYITVPLPK